MRDCAVKPLLYTSYTNYNNMKSYSTKGYNKTCTLANHEFQTDTVSFGSGEKEILKKVLKRTERKIHARISEVAVLRECIPHEKYVFLAPLRNVKRPNGKKLAKNEVIDIMICSDSPKLNLNSVNRLANIVDKDGNPIFNGKNIAILHDLNLEEPDFVYAEELAKKGTSTNKDIVHIMIARSINNDFTENLMNVKGKDGKQALNAVCIQSIVESRISPQKLPFIQELTQIEDNGAARFSGDEIEILAKNLDPKMLGKIKELAAKKEANKKFSYNGSQIVKRLKDQK